MEVSCNKQTSRKKQSTNLHVRLAIVQRRYVLIDCCFIVSFIYVCYIMYDFKAIYQEKLLQKFPYNNPFKE